ncbi:MAG: SDR family oxidoreductase [Isosphaeraceae bacterium]
MSGDGPGRMAGQTALIAGGTGGIGMAAGLRFVEEGARVVVAGLSVEDVERVNDGPRAGPRFRGVQAEVADPASVSRMFEEALGMLGGRLDVLVHVAGISARKYGDGPLHECSEEGWDAALSVNARGCFLTNRAAVRIMLDQPAGPVRGSIVNVGSVLAHSHAPHFFGTCGSSASKAAVRALTLGSAARYAADRIRFNLVEPGLIDTPMAARAVGNPAIRRYLQAKQPLTGGPGTPRDVAEAILFLAEPSTSFLTGVVVNADGGWCVSEGAIGAET